MPEILVLVEHRKGELREITFELLSKALELGEKKKANVTAVLLGHNVNEHAKKIVDFANEVLVINDPNRY